MWPSHAACSLHATLLLYGLFLCAFWGCECYCSVASCMCHVYLLLRGIVMLPAAFWCAAAVMQDMEEEVMQQQQQQPSGAPIIDVKAEPANGR